MIPLKIYMRNFMCYREQELNLRGIHLACLTGNNGHGKSAILDALTWALWGRSRVGARRDDELIHIGQSEMQVEFEFLLPGEGGNDTHYRVIRKRSRRRRGHSSLELHGWDPTRGRFRSLSGSSITRTQARINDLLRMDYETFINSAFLLQGRADEFTVKRPAERKRVLGDILGLGMYEVYEKRAKEAAQDRKERADQKLAAVKQIDRELAREQDYKEQLRKAEQVLARSRQEREQAEKEYERLSQLLQEAQAAQRELQQVQQRLASRYAEVKRLRGEIDDHRRRLGDLVQALADEQEIREGFAAYEQAVRRNEELNADLGRMAELNARRGELERRIAAARHALDKELQLAIQEVRRLEKQAGALQKEQEWQQLRDRLAHLDKLDAEREQARERIQSLTATMAALEAENKRSRQDGRQIRDKLSLLSTEGDARCPLCAQPLDDRERERLVASLNEELEAQRAAYRRRQDKIADLRRQVADLKARVAELERELSCRAGLQRQEAALAHVLDEARKAESALPTARQKQQELQRRLDKDDYALEERAALAQIVQELNALGYDPQEHNKVRNEVKQLRVYEKRMQTLREARANADTIRLAIKQLEQSLQQAEADLTTVRQREQALQEVASQLASLEQQTSAARYALENAHDREQQAGFMVGAARNKVENCAYLREQRAEHLLQERELREEQAIYQELWRALGKNGVQAMIIESAIPEIEREANRLLARMTRGSMQVRFETQRDTKKGGAVETLDIHIADERGTRSYETFSGGERYRIDFAIRVALSRLLTRRAGAQLQMLVIDEGFGSQDSEGRAGLIEAINAIRDDFACILVITHIEEMKDAFDVRIEVTKTPQGSLIAIV